VREKKTFFPAASKEERAVGLLKKKKSLALKKPLDQKPPEGKGVLVFLGKRCERALCKKMKKGGVDCGGEESARA